MAQDITHVDYEELGQIAAQFGQQSEEAQALQQAIKAAYNPLAQGDWQGEGSEAFVAEMSSLMFPGMERLHTALSEAQRTTTEVSQLIRQAEEEAAALFGGEHGSVGAGGIIAGASGSVGAPAQQEKGWLQRGVDMVSDAGSFLKNQGKQALGAIEDGINTVVGAAKDLGNNVLALSDKAIDAGLSQIIPKPPEGTTEKITVKLDGSLSVPGIEVGVPGSIKLTGARSASITHNADGTYTMTISDGAGVGLEETTGGASGSVTVGNTTTSGGVEASGSVMLNGSNEITLKFDPNKPGDMTKMAALGGAMGMPGFPAVAAAPILASLKDNVTGMKLEGGVDAEGKLSGAIAEGSLGVGLKGGGEIKLNDLGQREVITSVQLTAKGSGSATLAKTISLGGGAEGSVQIQNVHNLATGTDQAKVTVTLSGTGSASLKGLEGMLPPGASIDKGSFGRDASGKITVEYTLNQPAETVRQTFFNGGSPDLKALARQSSLEVKVATGGEYKLGAEGSVALPTQKIGVGVNGSVSHETERSIYKSGTPNG